MTACVCIIANDNLNIHFKDQIIPNIIRNMNMKAILMFSSSYSNNSKINYNDVVSFYDEIITYSTPIDISLFTSITGLIAVIPYTEDDIIDAEFISHSIGLNANNILYTQHRRNKYLMTQRVKDVGLRGIDQRICYSLYDIEDFIDNENKYVIKPIDGAASEDVYLCSTLSHLKTAYNKIIGKTNNCGILNKNCLIQEYIEGDDMIVNTVSRDGIHKIVSILQTYKTCVNGRHFMYVYTKLLDPQSVDPNLIVYALNVLNALGIQTGSGHAEIKMTKSGPCLIEIGARVGNPQSEGLSELCIQPIQNKTTGYSQKQANIYAYCNKDFFDLLPLLYSTTENTGICVTVNCLFDDVIWSDTKLTMLLHEIRHVVIVTDVKLTYANGSVINKTFDLLTTIGRIFIVSDDITKLIKCIEMIKEWEKHVYI